MNDKVFISYAKEDYIFAEKLYDFLKENDFKPWLDKKEILPGKIGIIYCVNHCEKQTI